jgi:DNA-binding transcriptional MerR regulator
MSDQMHIGEVAERTGLGQRTIRYYGELGLVPAAARSGGGFRLFSRSDLARFRLILQMKPLDFSLEEMKHVLDLLDALPRSQPGTTEHDALVEQLATYRLAVANRVRAIETQLETAEEFAQHLGGQLDLYRSQRVSKN